MLSVQTITSIAIAAAVAATAWRARALTASGAVAACVVGASIFEAGSWRYAAVLFSFFVPSIALSRVGRSHKCALSDVGKAARARDAAQVLANGGIAALCGVLAATTREPAFAAAFAGAFAAASSDTWGTEVGTSLKTVPRSILTLRPVAPGMSGGVTFAGTCAEAIGAVIVATVASSLGIASLLTIAAAGFAGALADSVLGATLQEQRYCMRCTRSCEINPHSCGEPTVLVRGLPSITNDTVNAAATATGAILAAVLSRVVH
jgi:uncharacterized protein (TIGR00297 family)